MFSNISFVEILIFSVICYSLTFGWIESPLFNWVRPQVQKIHDKLVTCYHCVGFYSGILSGILVFDARQDLQGLVFLVSLGLYGSGVCLLLDRIHLLIESLISREPV
jgi:hypothetical protein